MTLSSTLAYGSGPVAECECQVDSSPIVRANVPSTIGNWSGFFPIKANLVLFCHNITQDVWLLALDA